MLFDEAGLEDSLGHSGFAYWGDDDDASDGAGALEGDEGAACTAAAGELSFARPSPRCWPYNSEECEVALEEQPGTFISGLRRRT